MSYQLNISKHKGLRVTYINHYKKRSIRNRWSLKLSPADVCSSVLLIRCCVQGYCQCGHTECTCRARDQAQWIHNGNACKGAGAFLQCVKKMILLGLFVVLCTI